MGFITTARQAEECAAAVMRLLGYPDASTTGAGPDSGIDVVSSTALAQVKWQGAVVGRPELQKLVGARGRDTTKKLLFFAASGFSQAAVDYADDLEIALFLYDPAGVPTAQNLLAHKAIQRYLLTGPGSDDDSSEEEAAVAPVEPTEEESAAEIVAIVSELSIEKFNALHWQVKHEVRHSYRAAIVVADRLPEKFNNPHLAEQFDQQVEEEFNWRREVYKDWDKEEAKAAEQEEKRLGVTSPKQTPEQEHRDRLREFAGPRRKLSSREVDRRRRHRHRHEYLNRRREEANQAGVGPTRGKFEEVLGSGFKFSDKSSEQIVKREFRNPFDPKRLGLYSKWKYGSNQDTLAAYGSNQDTAADRYSFETPLNPLYGTHFGLMPFKFDQDGQCFAYDPERGTYEAFDRESRKFPDLNMEQEEQDRRTALAARMAERAETLRNL